jgi:hypothetical protein
MSAVLRRDAPEDAPARAKILRAAEPSPELDLALAAFIRATDEHARRHDAESSRVRRMAAFHLVVALSHEARRPAASVTLSASLLSAIERWEDGEFGGTGADIDVAEHAASELLPDGN